MYVHILRTLSLVYVWYWCHILYTEYICTTIEDSNLVVHVILVSSIIYWVVCMYICWELDSWCAFSTWALLRTPILWYVFIDKYIYNIPITYYFIHSSTCKYVEGVFLFTPFFECMMYVRGGYDFVYPLFRKLNIQRDGGSI